MRSATGILLSAILLLTSLAAETLAAPPPNIVLFLADDLGWADVPWHGSPAKMPHLDQLARTGVRLEAHYVHPMCSPTRAALLSGRYASRFGVTAAQNQRAYPWDTVTLAGALKAAGYETALTGKWHLGSKPDEGPQKFGFDHGYGSLAGGVSPYSHRYKEGEFSVTWHRNGKLIEEEGHVTDLIAREAVQWLEQRSGKPFFLYVPFTAIHVPIAEPEKWLQANAHLTDLAQRLRAASASHMDDAIGRVLAVLDRRKLRDNTLVLFLSDNGAHGPSPNQGGPYPGDYGALKVGNDNLPWRGHKSGVYEGGIRTPGIAHWPSKLLTRRSIHAAARRGLDADALQIGGGKTAGRPEVGRCGHLARAHAAGEVLPHAHDLQRGRQLPLRRAPARRLEAGREPCRRRQERREAAAGRGAVQPRR